MWTHQPLSATTSSNSRPQSSFAFLDPNSQDSSQPSLPHCYQSSYQTHQNNRGYESYYLETQSETSEYTMVSNQGGLTSPTKTQYEQQEPKEIEHFRSSRPYLPSSWEDSAINNRESGQTQYFESEKQQRQQHPVILRREYKNSRPSPSKQSFLTESVYETRKCQQKMAKSSTELVPSKREQKAFRQTDGRLGSSEVSAVTNSPMYLSSSQQSCIQSKSKTFNLPENTLAHFLNKLSHLIISFQQFQTEEYEAELEDHFGQAERKMESMETQCEAMIKQTRLIQTQIEEYMLDVAEEQNENSQLLKVYESIISTIRQENMLDNFRN